VAACDSRFVLFSTALAGIIIGCGGSSGGGSTGSSSATSTAGFVGQVRQEFSPSDPDAYVEIVIAWPQDIATTERFPYKWQLWSESDSEAPVSVRQGNWTGLRINNSDSPEFYWLSALDQTDSGGCSPTSGSRKARVRGPQVGVPIRYFLELVDSDSDPGFTTGSTSGGGDGSPPSFGGDIEEGCFRVGKRVQVGGWVTPLTRPVLASPPDGIRLSDRATFSYVVEGPGDSTAQIEAVLQMRTSSAPFATVATKRSRIGLDSFSNFDLSTSGVPSSGRIDWRIGVRSTIDQSPVEIFSRSRSFTR